MFARGYLIDFECKMKTTLLNKVNFHILIFDIAGVKIIPN